MKSIFVNDTIDGFLVSHISTSWKRFNLTCDNCQFSQVQRVYYSETSNVVAFFNNSRFIRSSLASGGNAFSVWHSSFEQNSTLILQSQRAYVNFTTFTNSSCIADGTNREMGITQNQFMNSYVGLLVTRSANMEGIYNNTFSGNFWGIVLAEDRWSVPYDTILKTLNSSKRFIPTSAEESGALLYNARIAGNTIKNNEYGVLVVDSSRDLTFNYNNIANSRHYNLVNYRRAALDASNNYWGVTTVGLIQAGIWDSNHVGSMGVVNFSPWSARPF